MALKCDGPLSNFAFNSSLRHYSVEVHRAAAVSDAKHANAIIDVEVAYLEVPRQAGGKSAARVRSWRRLTPV